MKGLELRVTDRGGKSFSVYRWLNGRAVRTVLGRYNPDAIQSDEFNKNPLSALSNNAGLSIEQARMLAAAVMMQLSLGRDPRSESRAVKGITLGEMFNRYLHDYAIDHTKTWKKMEESFYLYLGHWRNRPVASLKRSEVQLLINHLGRERGHTTANRTLELMRAVINRGKRWGLLECENPSTFVSKFKLQSRDRFVFEEELPRLVAAIEAEPNEDVKDFVLISLYTGARKTKVLTMLWQDVNLECSSWIIPDNKNNTTHTILLTEPEIEILQRRLDARTTNPAAKNHAFVFPGPGATGHLSDPKKGWHRILKRARIKNLHLHDLRRTLSSYMAITGASLSVIGNALNHKDLSTTRKVYALSGREDERRARQTAQAHMLAQSRRPNNPTSNVVPISQKKRNVEF